MRFWLKLLERTWTLPPITSPCANSWSSTFLPSVFRCRIGTWTRTLLSASSTSHGAFCEFSPHCKSSINWKRKKECFSVFTISRSNRKLIFFICVKICYFFCHISYPKNEFFLIDRKDGSVESLLHNLFKICMFHLKPLFVKL